MSDDELLARALDGACSAEERAAFIARLSTDPALARRWCALAGLQPLISDALADDADAFVRRTLAARRAVGTTSRFVSKVVARRAQRRGIRRRTTSRPWLLAAAMLLMAVGAGWLWLELPGPTVPFAVLSRPAAGLRVLRADQTVAGRAGMPLLPGDLLQTTAEGAEVLYPDQTRISLLPASEALLQDEDGAKRVRLDHGELRCEVAKQPAGKAMRVLSGQAEMEIVGTRFLVRADDTSTRLEVSEGRIRFTDRIAGGTVEVGAGGFAEARVRPGPAVASARTAMSRLRVRTAGPNAYRLIEDAEGRPFFVAGWCIQNLVHTLPVERFDAYFQAMHGKGFNTAWVNASGWDGRPDPNSPNPRDSAGNMLQRDSGAVGSGGSLETANLNPLYAASVDALVDAAGRNGIHLFLDVMNEPGQGFAKRGQAECVSWGRFWGGRYAARPQVNFLLGNNRLPQPQADWIVAGIREACADRLFVVDLPSVTDRPGRNPTLVPNPLLAITGALLAFGAKRWR